MQVVQGGRSGHAAVTNPGHAKFVVSGPLAATEDADAAVVAGTVVSSGSLAASEATDIVAFVGATGAGANAGILAATEAADTSAIAGSVICVGTLSAIEAADSFAGTGSIIDAGSAFGVLAASEAADTAEVVGDVTGEVAPPVSVGGGYWRPYRQPVAVEGVGYAILPQLEGEAHGLVGTDADGVATLSDVVGAAVATAGVAGRSEARLAIRAAVIGDCGPAGSGSGVVTLKGAAIGRHDDDEAAMIALLLAA
jgi:hypothetical protein